MAILKSPTPSSFRESIKALAQRDPKRVVYPESTEPRVLRAVEAIMREGVAKPILLGDEAAVRAKIAELGLGIKGVQIVDPSKSDKFETYAQAFFEIRKNKGITIDDARKMVRQVNYFGTMMVQLGDADGMVSGSTHSTADTIRPALQIIKTKKKFHKISGVFFIILEKHILLFADAAVNIQPDAKDLAEIALDTAQTARRFGIEPRVAMLSFSTNGSANHPLVDKVKEATAIVKDRDPSLMVDGEMQVDAALVPEVRARKYPGCTLTENANVLIFPDLQAANISYKMVERLAKANAIGPIIQGLRKPVNDLSRGCSWEDIVDVTAFTVVDAQGVDKMSN